MVLLTTEYKTMASLPIIKMCVSPMVQPCFSYVGYDQLLSGCLKMSILISSLYKGWDIPKILHII